MAYPSHRDKTLIANAIQSQSRTIEAEETLYLNNSIYIPWTTNSPSGYASSHSNAGLYLKDISSGNGTVTWYSVKANNNDLYFNNGLIITANNAVEELETLYESSSSNVSNIIVSGGYINFTNGTSVAQGTTGVGLRYSNEHVQFKNYGNSWVNIESIGSENLDALNDVVITSVTSNQYLLWNSTSSKWINSNLTLIHDPTPTLGGNLNLNSYDLLLASGNTSVSIANSSSNNIASFQDTSGVGGSNYINIANAQVGAEPYIECLGVDTDVGLSITTKGSGSIILDSNTGNIILDSPLIDATGVIKYSIYRSTSKSGGYVAGTAWAIPVSADILLFTFSNSNASGTYWANVTTAFEGQKLNLLFYNSGSSNIELYVDFGTNRLCSGSGLATRLKMSNSGQGASVVYLETPDIWQILNAGAIVS